MSTLRKLVMVLSVPFLFLLGGAAVAQQSPPQSQSDAPPQSSSGAQGATPDNGPPEQSAPSTTAPTGGPACWQQAGISQKAMRTRQSIVSNAKTQIQKVTDDTSLAPQQQRRQIRQIRQNARQQIARIITPEQERSLQECQRQRKGNAVRPDSSQTDPHGTEPN